MEQNNSSDLATKDYVRAEVGKVETAMAQGFGEANTAIAGIRTEISDMSGEITEKLGDKLDAQNKWIIGTAIAIAVLILSAIALLLNQ